MVVNRNVPRFNMVGPVDQVAERISQDVLGVEEDSKHQGNWFFVQAIKSHLKSYVYLLKLHDPEQVVTFHLLVEMYKDPQFVRRMHEKLKTSLVALTVSDENKTSNDKRVLQIIDEWFDLNLLPKQERAGAFMVTVRNEDNEIVYYDAKEEYVQGLRNFLFDIELALLADEERLVEHSSNHLNHPTSMFLPFGKDMDWDCKNYYEPFNPEKSNNANMVILGKQGTGMNLAVKHLLVHEIPQNVHSRIIDADGEYSHIVGHLLGQELTLTQKGDIRINPLEITEKYVLEKELNIDEMKLRKGITVLGTTEFNGDTYITYLPVVEKTKEALEFFDLVVRGYQFSDSKLTWSERERIERALLSLYSSTSMQERGRNPILSDVYTKLMEHEPAQDTDRLLAALRPLLQDGTLPIFDGLTSLGETPESRTMTGKQLVSFNLSRLDENYLRPIAYHVILRYLKETFMENNLNSQVNKVIYANKFDMNIENEDTLQLTEELLRKTRISRAGLRIIAKDGGRILSNKSAKHILQYCSILLFKQNKIDRLLLDDTFSLTEEEMDFLLTDNKSADNEALWMHNGMTETIVHFPVIEEH